MTELGQLALVFTALYLFECVAWVPRRALFFVPLLGRVRARAVVRPNPGWTVGAALAVPWPPLSPAFVAEPLPVGFGPGGVWLEDDAGPRAFLPWPALGPVMAAGERVRAGGAILCVCASKRGAAALADALERARTADGHARAAALASFLDERLRADDLGPRQADFARGTRALRIALSGLWLALFGGLALLLVSRALGLVLPVAGLVGCGWLIGVLAWRRALRRCTWLRPAHWPDRTRRVVAVASPLSLLRACDLLARELYGDRDPVAVAACLADRATLARLARARLAALVHPANPSAPVAAADVPPAELAWYRETCAERLENLLATRSLARDELLAIPPRQHDGSVAYCPACHARYPESLAASARCERAACAGVALVRY